MGRLMTLGIVTFLLAGLGFCQSSDGTYRIQVEDELGIAVFDESQISARVIVTPDGNITPPFAKPIRAVGKTTSEIETELADFYKSELHLRNPRVSVTILRVRRILATMSGNVERPGQYEVRKGMRVRDLIAMGVARDELGDLRHATFKRKTWNESIPLDLYAMIVKGQLSQNYEVEDGDEITVPPKKGQFIKVTGEVVSPTNVQYDEDMDLVTALNIARGVVPRQGKKTKILVVRPKAGNPGAHFLIQCDLVAYEKKQDYSQNVKLFPGDTVIVLNNGNPNFEIFNSFANAIFILDRFGINLGVTRN